MTQDDLNYFQRRQQQELSMAANAQDQMIALTHAKLADAYGVRLRELSKPSLSEERRTARRPSTTSGAIPLLRN